MAFFDGASAGGAFRLTEAAAEGSTEIIGDWTIEVRAGSEIVVARGEGGATYEEARDDALAAANKGLDFLCLRGATPMAIRHAGTEHIVWWSEESQSVIRVLSIPAVTLHVGKVTVSGGTPTVPPPPEWQESARYFRLSQLTDDLFDAFRNVYLAMESILDHLAPQRTTPPLEREGEWFRRALIHAGEIVNLAGHAPKGASDPVEALYDELTSRRGTWCFTPSPLARICCRTAALSGAPSKRPPDERHISISRWRRRSSTSGRRVAGGSREPGGCRLTVSHDASGIVVTNDPAPFSADDTAINPSGGDVVGLSVSRASEHDRPFEHAFLGVGEGAKVAELGRVTRVGSTVDGEPHSAGIPEGAFLVSDVDRFEALDVLRARNANEPKRDFAS